MRNGIVGLDVIGCSICPGLPKVDDGRDILRARVSLGIREYAPPGAYLRSITLRTSRGSGDIIPDFLAVAPS
jgi:hypothetical protein